MKNYSEIIEEFKPKFKVMYNDALNYLMIQEINYTDNTIYIYDAELISELLKDKPEEIKNNDWFIYQAVTLELL
jgi:hypothetical protein